MIAGILEPFAPGAFSFYGKTGGIRAKHAAKQEAPFDLEGAFLGGKLVDYQKRGILRFKLSGPGFCIHFMGLS